MSTVPSRRPAVRRTRPNPRPCPATRSTARSRESNPHVPAQSCPAHGDRGSSRGTTTPRDRPATCAAGHRWTGSRCPAGCHPRPADSTRPHSDAPGTPGTARRRPARAVAGRKTAASLAARVRLPHAPVPTCGRCTRCRCAAARGAARRRSSRTLESRSAAWHSRADRAPPRRAGRRSRARGSGR